MDEDAREYYSTLRVKILEGENGKVVGEILKDLERPASGRIFAGLPDERLMPNLRGAATALEIENLMGAGESVDLMDYHHVFCGQCARCGSFYGCWGVFDWRNEGPISVIQAPVAGTGSSRVVADLPAVGCPCFEREAEVWAMASPRAMLRRAAAYYGELVAVSGAPDAVARLGDLGVSAGEGAPDVDVWRLGDGPYRDWWRARSAAAIVHLPWAWWMRLVTQKLPSGGALASEMRRRAEEEGVDAGELLTRAMEEAKKKTWGATH